MEKNCLVPLQLNLSWGPLDTTGGRKAAAVTNWPLNGEGSALQLKLCQPSMALTGQTHLD